MTLCLEGRRETVKLRSRRARTWMDRAFFLTFGRVPGGQAGTDALVDPGRASPCTGAPSTPCTCGPASTKWRIYIDLGDETREVIEVDALRVAHRRAGARSLRAVDGDGRPPEAGPRRPRRRAAALRQRQGRRTLPAAHRLDPGSAARAGAVPGLVPAGRARFGQIDDDPPGATARGPPRVADARGAARSPRPRHQRALGPRARVRQPRHVALALGRVVPRLDRRRVRDARALCTDDEEIIFDFVRPIVLNGIDHAATRPDLADRCLLGDAAGHPEGPGAGARRTSPPRSMPRRPRHLRRRDLCRGCPGRSRASPT